MPDQPITYPCPTCGKLNKSVFCRSCFNRSRSKGETRTCVVCGKQFYRRPSALRDFVSLYCSHTCANVGKKKSFERPCEKCGKLRKVHPGKAGGGFPQTLCADCYRKHGEGRAEKLRGIQRSTETRKKLSISASRPKPWLVKPRVEVDCAHCGQSFEYAAYPSRQTPRYCSTACWYEHIREHPEDIANYVDGRYRIYGPYWSAQATLARERDNFTCQGCGRTDSDRAFDVHHIRPLRFFGDDFAAAHDLSNLVTLCRSCHMRAERGGWPLPESDIAS